MYRISWATIVMKFLKIATLAWGKVLQNTSERGLVLAKGFKVPDAHTHPIIHRVPSWVTPFGNEMSTVKYWL